MTFSLVFGLKRFGDMLKRSTSDDLHDGFAKQPPTRVVERNEKK